MHIQFANPHKNSDESGKIMADKNRGKEKKGQLVFVHKQFCRNIFMYIYIWYIHLYVSTINLCRSIFLWMVMFSSTSRFLKSFCGFGAQTCPFDMMKVRGHHPTSYTITLNQSHYGILVYSGRCRTLDRSCPQFNCVCVFFLVKFAW